MRLILWAIGLFSLVGIVVSSKNAGGNVPSVSIYGGVPAATGEFPYMAFLDLSYAFCGGSLISSSHILTAAHCLDSNQSYASEYTVLVNTSNYDGSSPGAITRQVKKIIVHPTSDIGLLVLSKPVTGIKPIPLPPTTKPTTIKPATTKTPTRITTPFYSCICAPLSEYANMNAVVTGWGKRAPGPDEPSTKALLKANVTIYDDSVCVRQYGSSFKVGLQLCAAAPGRDTCQGDSGGPIIVNGVVVGVTSWGYACADPNHSGVYVRISAFLDWIKTNMANNAG